MGEALKPSLLVLVAVSAVFALSSASLAQSCIPQIPDVIISPSSLTAPPGQTAVFTVDVENEDSDNCAIGQYTMSATNDGGFSVTFSPSTLFIQPKDSETTLMRVSVPSGTVAGEYRVTAITNNGQFSGSDEAVLEIRPDVTTCEVRVSSLRFKEKNANTFESSFAKDDDVYVTVDVSLLGTAPSDVTLDLFVDGNLHDSEKDAYPANSDTTFRFGNAIKTKSYVDDIDVKVVATATCNPSETDEDSDNIDIIESEEDIDLDITIGNPGSGVVGKDVLSRVFIENNGEEDVKVNVDAKLCGENGCRIEMNCGDSTILVEDDDTEEVVCVGRATDAGKYRVEAEVTFEGDEDTERSNDFFIYSSDGLVPKTGTAVAAVNSTPAPEEVVERLKQIKYVCNGNMRQAIFTTTEGVSTSDIEYCPNGCATGSCKSVKSPVKGTTVLVPGTDGDNTPKPTFNRPSYTPPAFNLDDFLGWLKNLLFSEPS